MKSSISSLFTCFAGSSMKSTTITAIDIGTSSIKLLIGQKEADSPSITIIEKREVPQTIGVKRSEIYNPKNISETISSLKEKIQKTKGIKIKKAVVNIGGTHLSVIRSQGLVSVSRADQKISQEDIKRVFQASQAVNLPSNQEVLDTKIQEYLIDGEKGVKDPLGLEGFRLEAKALLICVFSPILENLERAVYESKIEIEKIIPSILASSRAVLTEQQRELGVAVVDIGAGTTSLSVFSEGNLVDFVVFPMGASNITNDIAIGLRTEISTAERIKKEFGSLSPFISRSKKKNEKKKEKIEIPEKNISFSNSLLEKIVTSRISEVFSEINKNLKKISKESILPGGVVLTGGGSLLPGMADFAKEKFELPCYLSGPKKVVGVEEPTFSTCAGLLLSGFEAGGEEILMPSEGRLRKIFKIFLP